MNLSVSKSNFNATKNKHQSFGTCTNPPTAMDKVLYFVRTEPIKASLIGGSALLLTILGIVKHKSIANFIKNLFKK